MRYCRFLFQCQTHYGKVEERGGEPWIVELIDAPPEDLAYRLEHGYDGFTARSFEPMPLSAANLLPPVTPPKIVCVGRNYRAHVAELQHQLPAEPVIFLKPPSALLSPGGVIMRPPVSVRVDYEGELALVIGKRASRLKEDDRWREYVRGYTIANDVTARDLQTGQWALAKGFDSFCPVGPLVSDEIDPVAGVFVETRVNGELRQHGSTTEMIFSLAKVLSYITAAITLEPGDLVLTGTPAGIGPMASGDRVEVSIQGLGVLSNSVR